MRLSTILAIALLTGLSTVPALASPCATDIENMAKQVKEESRESISASTSGKAVAGAREGQGVTGAVPPDASQAQPEKSAAAGRSAENVQAAKVALDEARTLDGKGDGKGCADAIARVKKELSRTP